MGSHRAGYPTRRVEWVCDVTHSLMMSRAKSKKNDSLRAWVPTGSLVLHLCVFHVWLSAHVTWLIYDVTHTQKKYKHWRTKSWKLNQPLNARVTWLVDTWCDAHKKKITKELEHQVAPVGLNAHVAHSWCHVHTHKKNRNIDVQRAGAPARTRRVHWPRKTRSSF